MILQPWYKAVYPRTDLRQNKPCDKIEFTFPL